MNLELDEKVILVTGSSSGIGFEIAKLFHREGCNLAINGRDRQKLLAAESSLPGSVGFEGDFACQLQASDVINKVIEKFGRLDTLVCNVGSGKSVPPGGETVEEWNRVFSQNLWATTNAVEAAKSFLKDSKGSIICISSICGIEVINGAPITYSVAKAALNAYVKGMARPLGKDGIRINAVAPGNILFDTSVWARKIKENPTAVNEMLKENVALGFLGKPTDVACVVAFLASSVSGFVTGSIWTTDGGQVH
jgi:NAD(P)-dependent dehydrogenase (short-subunit alcohol dehydrogenase family)